MRYDVEMFPDVVFADSWNIWGRGNVLQISHILRAFILTEFVTGVRPKDSGRESFSTKTKKGVIDGFVRHIKNAYTAVDKY